MLIDPQARIVDKKIWNDYVLLRLESSSIASSVQPGQFVMVRVTQNSHPLLRRPFSIHSRDGKHLEIFFKISGLGTTILSQKKAGGLLDILGPLGKGFLRSETLKGKHVFLVGGGRGIAPLYFLAQELRSSEASVKILCGGRTGEDIPLREKIEGDGFDLSCSTDDGSFGFKGLVTDLLEKELQRLTPACLFACGPELMMKKISRIARSKKIPAQFSLESVMGCGFGACWGCVRRIKKNGVTTWTKICQEGPVFRGDDIIWQDEEK